MFVTTIGTTVHFKIKLFFEELVRSVKTYLETKDLPPKAGYIVVKQRLIASRRTNITNFRRTNFRPIHDISALAKGSELHRNIKLTFAKLMLRTFLEKNVV